MCGAGGESLANHLEADAHGGVSLGADGLGGLVVHRDPLGGGGDEDGKVFLVLKLLAQDGAQNLFGASQVDAEVVVACSEDGPADLGIGGLVGAHCVNDDVDRHLGNDNRVSIAG